MSSQLPNAYSFPSLINKLGDTPASDANFKSTSIVFQSNKFFHNLNKGSVG